jgi:hypothetical protein
MRIKIVLSLIRADQRLRTFFQAIAILVILTSFSGCGRDETQQILPTSTASDVDKKPLIFLVPSDTKAFFLGILTIAENSGIPYEVETLEVIFPTAGAQAISDGHGDVMFVMELPWPDEQISYYEIFRTPTAFFINAGVGLDNLTSEQVTAILSGEVTNWSQIGGPDLEIHLFIQQENDSNTEAVRQYLLGERPFAPSAQIIFNDLQLIPLIGGLPGAVGFTSWAGKQFYGDLISGSFPTIVSLDGLAPNHIDYPLVGSMGLIYRSDRQEFLQPLLDWVGAFLESEFGSSMIERYGYNLFYASPNDSGIGDDANNE